MAMSDTVRVLDPYRVIQILKETPMTPSERLLNAAHKLMEAATKACSGSREEWEGGIKPTACYEAFVQLEAAVKECEAAEVTPLVSDHPCGCPIDSPVHTKDCRKAAVMGPPIDADALRAAFREISSGYAVSPINQLTDQQRRLGLRSLRHVGKDYANWDYD